jgi:hypothetical protein
MEMPRRPLHHRQHMATPWPFARTIPPNRRDNTRAAVTSIVNAPSTSVGSSTATPVCPIENACLADSVASLVPPLTLIFVLAYLILKIGFTAETPLSINEAYAVLLVATWAVVPIVLGAEPRVKLLRWSFAGLAPGFALMSMYHALQYLRAAI